jgi:hypothetical protein
MTGDGGERPAATSTAGGSERPRSATAVETLSNKLPDLKAELIRSVLEKEKKKLKTPCGRSVAGPLAPLQYLFFTTLWCPCECKAQHEQQKYEQACRRLGIDPQREDERKLEEQVDAMFGKLFNAMETVDGAREEPSTPAAPQVDGMQREYSESFAGGGSTGAVRPAMVSFDLERSNSSTSKKYDPKTGLEAGWTSGRITAGI